jgi:uncharacterized protein involved in response to NO
MSFLTTAELAWTTTDDQGIKLALAAALKLQGQQTTKLKDYTFLHSSSNDKL